MPPFVLEYQGILSDDIIRVKKIISSFPLLILIDNPKIRLNNFCRNIFATQFANRQVIAVDCQNCGIEIPFKLMAQENIC